MPADVKDGVKMEDIDKALHRDHRMDELIGIGRITDPEHPALRAVKGQASRTQFMIYAKKDLAPFTVVGEYVGTIYAESEYDKLAEAGAGSLRRDDNLCLYSSVRKGKKDDGLIICKSSHTDSARDLVQPC